MFNLPAMPNKQPFYVRLTIVLVCIVFVVLIMRGASTLLIPLFSGLLLAILLLPLTSKLQSWRFSRSGAAITSVTCFLVALAALNYFLTEQVALFSQDLPLINTKVQLLLPDFRAWLSVHLHIDQAEQIDYMGSSLKDIVNWMTGFASELFLSVGNILIWIVFTCIYTFFILYYRQLLVRFVLKLMENDYPDAMLRVIEENKKVLKGYILGLVIEFALVLIMTFITLLFLGIKYALMLSIIVAVLNIIPYIGIYTAILLVMLVTYANGTGGAVIQVAIALLIIHIIDAIFLLPRVLGSHMKMNPFITLIAVIIGDIVWGIPGMFLFIPLAAMLKIIFENIPSLSAWGILFGEEQKKVVKKKIVS